MYVLKPKIICQNQNTHADVHSAPASYTVHIVKYSKLSEGGYQKLKARKIGISQCFKDTKQYIHFISLTES